MTLRKIGFIFPLLIMLGLAMPAFAGGGPFAGQAVKISTTAETGAQSPSLPPIVEGKGEVATVEVETSLNIRTSPWGDVTGNLKNGEKISIIGQLGDWYKVSVNGKTAYVHSAYVKRKGEGKKPFATSGWVNSAIGLNVRRVPHGDIVGVLKDQKPVEILGVVGDYYKIKWGQNEAFVAKRYIDSDAPKSPANGVEKENFVGYVIAEALNVRRAPWGAIDGTLPKGIAVKITGKIDDWYRIDYNGQIRYVHANYITKNKSDGSPATNTAPAGTPVASGNLQQKIVASAKALIGSTAFRTADVDYGNLACAKVVTTALKNAGALNSVRLNVRSTVADLKAKGWREVTVPPFAEGDVITWKTYDYTGDGVKDPDTHVGIMVKEGSSFKAMNNSSRLRTPRLSDPYAVGPISRVLRKVA